MEMKTTIKLNQPKELPATGLTTVQIKPWKNHVVTFLMQDPDNQEFLPGGMYEEWLAASDNLDKTGERISLVQVKEEDMKMNKGLLAPFLGNVSLHDAETKNEHHELLAEAKEKQKKKLKTARNNQLARMIQHIASFVHYTEQDNIIQNSTSVRLIWTYLENHYTLLPRVPTSSGSPSTTTRAACCPPPSTRSSGPPSSTTSGTRTSPSARGSQAPS